MRITSVLLFLVLVAFSTVPAGTAFQLHFKTYCLDGDGELTDWVSSRLDAYLVGSEHELAFRGHRWEIWSREAGGSTTRYAVCARLSDGAKPDTVRLENTCGKCTRFVVSRKTADGETKRREFELDAKKSRHFRKLPGAVIRVEGEGECTE
ncbi:MAG: hypothetical protein ACJ72Z_08650 [Pyrinomonadaceae bacterium]